MRHIYDLTLVYEPGRNHVELMQKTLCHNNAIIYPIEVFAIKLDIYARKTSRQVFALEHFPIAK
jgi:sulfur transfer complex TusBCD TusB component (DsrH family)